MTGRTLALELKFDRSRAKQMTRIPVARANTRYHIDPRLVIDRLERLQRCDGIGLGIDWTNLGPAARCIAPVEGNDLRFLNASGMRQHIGTEVDRSAGRQDPSAEAFARQLRQQPAVVDVSMRQQHNIDVGGPERKGAIIEFLQGLLALEQAAVDQETSGLRLDQIAGPCHGARRAAKSNGYAHGFISGKLVPLISPRSAATKISSSGIALVGCGTLLVERMERMPASANSIAISGGNRACVITASIALAPAALSAFAQAIKVPPDETISSTSSTGRPATDAGSGNQLYTARSPRRIFCATACASPSRPARSLTHGLDSASGPTTIVAGSIPVMRTALAMAGIADRFSASMPGKTALMSVVRCR